MIRVHLYLSGRVQGVGFRSSTVRKARSLGVVGWVRNLADGRVEIVAEGEKGQLEELVAWCKDRVLFARVDDLRVSWEDSTGEFSSFEVTLRTVR